MKFWTPERLSELSRMANEEKLSTQEIGVHFERSAHAISQILYSFKILTSEELHRRHGDRGRIYREIENAEILKVLSQYERSPEMGYCLGALMGDGSICNGVSEVRVRDEAFAKEVFKQINLVTGGRAKFHARYRKHVAFIGTHKVVSDGIYYWAGNCNKAAAEFFASRINEKFILSQNAEFISSFLRGSFDSDGSVPRRETEKPNRWSVEITVLRDDENSLIEACLRRLGIGFRPYITKGRYGCQPQHRIVIRAHRDVLRFSELVGFTTSHRRERLNQMVEVISKGGAQS